nr:peptide chain release factor N(5)-glutamine methyltransferase [Actinomycetota bacterium]
VLAPAITSGQVDAFAEVVRRRQDREPLQYLLGHAAFRHLDLAVGPGVFIPRPETELLVDAVLPHLAAIAHPVVVDLCAGSGALGLAIATECPAADVTVVEHSTDALAWLRGNVEALGGGRVRIVAGDVTDPHLLSDPAGLGALVARVDAVLSNPPYVPEGSRVDAEVDHDPPEAVFAGADGLDLMPGIIALAAALLRSGGRLALEHSETHGPALLEAFEPRSWRDVAGHEDLTARPRYVVATKA